MTSFTLRNVSACYVWHDLSALDASNLKKVAPLRADIFAATPTVKAICPSEGWTSGGTSDVIVVSFCCSDANDQSDMSERGLDVGRHQHHRHRRSLFRRCSSRLRQHACLERGMTSSSLYYICLCCNSTYSYGCVNQHSTDCMVGK